MNMLRSKDHIKSQKNKEYAKDIYLKQKRCKNIIKITYKY